MIGNPIKAVPRYANFAWQGYNKQSPYLYGTADTLAYNTGRWITENPTRAIGGGLVVGGLALAMQPNEEPIDSMPPRQQIMMQPQVPTGYPSVPYPVTISTLDEEERKKQADYLERKVATDLLTIQALQRRGY